ncbi:hypothetical protein OIU84_017975 [Salix udensis]|uniref:Secreted protein n=1 Tax=Salix udensis TaxID=889485 RepID=A0AAD6L390_9ROSI|nr:hypothetical protein OIU84_017975 [Salix udensis]
MILKTTLMNATIFFCSILCSALCLHHLLQQVRTRDIVVPITYSAVRIDPPLLQNHHFSSGEAMLCSPPGLFKSWSNLSSSHLNHFIRKGRYVADPAKQNHMGLHQER